MTQIHGSDYARRGAGLAGLKLVVVVVLALTVAACGAPNPKTNTPTSGHLVVFADEIYAPMVKDLADTFMLRSTDATVEVRAMPARAAVQALFDAYARDTSHADTSVVYAIVIGRRFLPDELDASAKGGIDSKEYLLAYDGLAVVVPDSSTLHAGMLEGLRRALRSHAATASMIDTSAPAVPIRFLLPDQNSSTYAFVRGRLMGDSDIVAAAQYFSSGDSVLRGVLAGRGIGLLGWVAAHRDSVRARTLALGFLDSTGLRHPPAIIHPTSLVTDTYPLKQPIYGYTFASNQSPAVGFMAWLARSQDAQYWMAHHGLQPENVKIRIILPDHPE